MIPVPARREMARSVTTEACSTRSRPGSTPLDSSPSNRSRVASTARSPMAWMAATPPRSTAARAICSWRSGSRRSVPVVSWSRKGRCMAAVWPPRLPSAKPFQPQNRSRGPAACSRPRASSRRAGSSAITSTSTSTGRSGASRHRVAISSPTPHQRPWVAATMAPTWPMPRAASPWKAARAWSSPSGGARGSRASLTMSTAVSRRTPVGRPWSSRSRLPPAGSGLSAPIPARSRAAELATATCPQ